MNRNSFHVIDLDISRRGQITSDLASLGLHVEVYDDFAQFADADVQPGGGILLLADNPTGEDLDLALAAELDFLPIIVYGEHPLTTRVVDVVRRGALDYLEWPLHKGQFESLWERINLLEADHLLRMKRVAVAMKLVASLTRREREVFAHLFMGLNNKQIGRTLGISARTVEIHRTNLMRRLAARSIAEAVRIGFYAGFDDEVEAMELTGRPPTSDGRYKSPGRELYLNHRKRG